MLGAASSPRAIGIAVLGAVGAAAVWGGVRWLKRRSRRTRSAFVGHYLAVVQGVVPVGQARAAWAKRLTSAVRRYGEGDPRVVALRTEAMTFDMLAGDRDAVAAQADAVVSHLGRADDDTRGLFGASLNWLCWRERRRPGRGRCRAAFEAVASNDAVAPDERVWFSLGLARTAAETGRLDDARFIVAQLRSIQPTTAEPEPASPYRSRPQGEVGDESASELAFEILCAALWVELDACDLPGSRSALGELSAWAEHQPKTASVVSGRLAYWRGMVDRQAGDYEAAVERFAAADQHLAGSDDPDADAPSHRAGVAVAWVQTLLVLERPEDAAAAARHLAEGGPDSPQVSLLHATALLKLGDDDDAAALLAGVAEGTGPGWAAAVRALSALRQGRAEAALRWVRRVPLSEQARSPFAAQTLLAVGRVLHATGRARLADRVVRSAAAQVIDRLGPTHPELVGPYRFLAERSRAAGRPRGAASLDDAAEALLQRVARR